MKFSVLASSSKGNCTYVEAGDTRILVDAGLRCSGVCERLASIGRSLGDIQAVLVTHGHSDHTSSLPVIEGKTGVPVYATDATASTIERDGRREKPDLAWNFAVFSPGDPFPLGDLEVEPFAIPHDAADPVGFVLRAPGGATLGFATDLGEAPVSVARRLAGCNALVLEFNHDPEMLLASDRDWRLKQRILGRSGHLSNEQAAVLLAQVATPALRHVVPAHLSDECNRPSLALSAARGALRRAGLDPAAVLRDPVYPTPLFEL
ncbi:MAG: MBL fold metallo-hydrolase [Kiritimatiellae bacterium]|nr:MBL fold metallo-hydrolase [Kiritimatiellia bacterium]MBQ6246224.1 MBL fold metallo-hydrolase [Kiritimatiellia bacterium]